VLLCMESGTPPRDTAQVISEESGERQSGEREQQGKSQGFWSGLLADLRLPLLFSVFLAIPAFIFGIASFWETHREAFDASSAYVNQRVPTKDGYGIHLTLANNGNPPVVIDRAALDLPDAAHNMPLHFYLADPRAIDAYSTDSTRVSAEKQTLPIAVNPHSAQTVVLLANAETLNNGRTKKRVAREEQQEFCDFIRPDDEVAPAPRPTLILHLKWSGFVFDGPFQSAPDTESLEVRLAGDKLAQASWSAAVTGSPDAPTSVLFKHHLAEPLEGDLAKMTVYRHSDPSPIYSLKRPLVGHSPTAFPLPHLDKSTYLVAFNVDGDVVLTSRLQIPTTRKPGFNLADTGPTGFCSPNAEHFRRQFDARIAAGLSG
jgi:hypothetical protein